MNTATKIAVDTLCEGTMKAASQMVQQTTKFPKLKGYRETNYNCYCELVVGALRQTLKANIIIILKEWQTAIDSNLGGLWIKELLNAQCNQQAIEALKMVEEEL